MLAILPHAQAQENDPALKLYFVANGAYNRGLYPTAAGRFSEFLQKYENHAKADLARQGLALCYYADKKYADAIPHLTILLGKGDLEKTIKRDRLVIYQGQCLLRTGKKEDAKNLFVTEESKLKEAAYRASALGAICDISFGQSQWAEVTRWSTKLLALTLKPDQAARAHYQQGFSFYRLKNYPNAISALEKVGTLKAAPLWKTRSTYLLGECYSREKNFAKAESALTTALPGLKGTDLSDGHWRRGVARYFLKKWKPAQSDFAAYLKTAGANAKGARANEAQFYLGRCHLELGDPKAAEKAFTGVSTQAGSAGARASLWLGRVHSQAKTPNYDKAAEILAPAVTRFAQESVIDELRFDYANALMGCKNPDWKKASDALQQINGSTFGQMADVLAQRALCLHKLQDYAQSSQVAEQFLKQHKDHPRSANTQFLRAENLFLLKEADRAARVYESFLRAHKDHARGDTAALRLAQIHHQKGRWDRAVAAAKPLLAAKPSKKLEAQLTFLIGDSHYRQEQWADAHAALEKFLNHHLTGKGKARTATAALNVDTALVETAVAFEKDKKPEKALAYLDILSRYPAPTKHRALAFAELGRIAYRAENYPLARQALEAFLKREAENKDDFRTQAAPFLIGTSYYLGWIEMDQEKFEPAAARFAEASRDPNHHLAKDAAFQQGLAYVRGKNFAEAAQHFPKVIQRYRDHPAIQLMTYYAGLSLARLDKWNQAEPYLRQVADSWPDFEFADRALYEWAWCERNRDRKDQATKLYERFVKKYPQSSLFAKVQSELAELSFDSGDIEKMIRELTAAVAKTKDPALRENMRYQLATAHYRKKDYEVAAKQFEQLLKDYPKSTALASMRYQAGESRRKLKETVAARAHYQAGLKIESLSPAVAEPMLLHLAEVETSLNFFDAAQENYVKFLKRFPQSAFTRNAQFGLGWCRENSDDPEGAIKAYTKLLDKKPADLWTVRAHFQTGECYFNDLKYDQAIAKFEHVEESYKDHPSWQSKSVLEIGRIRAAQKKTDEAKELFKKVITKYPKQGAAVLARKYLDQLRTQ